MTWTADKPTVPGYYWQQADSSLFPRILCICEAVTGLVVFNTGSERPPYLANFNPPGSRWAGPILPPAEVPPVRHNPLRSDGKGGWTTANNSEGI